MRAAFEELPESKSGAIIKAGVEEFSRCTYADANTDRITAGCGISKGLLYHYFGTKRAFYLYCLQHALEVLTKTEATTPDGDFYTIIFTGMERKMRLCAKHPAEVKLLNMASREFSSEVRTEKDELFAQYAEKLHADSERVMAAAVAALELKCADRTLAAKGLGIYANALVNSYLQRYQDAPEEFFSRREAVEKEMKSYIDLMLYGICKEKK